ncbi:MAG: SURF1 family protein, partial [Gammaproteobacteria bacterium]|nr:SURF1 family protein [Gammaproteobacteria bacterium]
MKLAEISFRPTLLPTLLTLVLVPLLAALGFWQLDRAEQKRQIQLQFTAGASTLVELGKETVSLPRYQRVRVRGRFDQSRQFLLDNMLDEGKPGSHVLGLLEIQGVSQRLLVNLGWVEAAADRSVLAQADLPGGELVLTGRLDKLPRPGLKLASEPLADDGRWPKRVVYPD